MAAWRNPLRPRGGADRGDPLIERLEQHRRAALAIMASLPWWKPPASDRSFTRPDLGRLDWMRTGLIPQLGADDLRSFGVALIDAFSTYDGYYTAGRLLGSVAQQRPAFDEVDLELLFDLALRPDVHLYGTLPAVKFATTAAKRFATPVPALQSAYEEALVRLDQADFDPGVRAKVRVDLRELLRQVAPRPADAGEPEFHLAAVRTTDGWGPYLHEVLAGAWPDGEVLTALFEHAATITAPRPTKKWRRRAEELVAAAPTAEGVLHEALAAATRCPTATVTNHWMMQWQARVGSDNFDVLRGLIWCAMAIEPRPDWLFAELVAISQESMAEHNKVMGASIAAIGESEDPAAVGTLVRFQRSTRDRGFLKVINGALDTAAERSGMGRSELLETTVPDEGLAADGTRAFVLGDLTATIAVDDQGKVTTSWARSGQTLRGVPADAKGEWKRELAEVKRVAAEVRKLVSSERERLERLTTETRSWPLPTFEARYLRHPVTAPLARHLIWTVTSADGDRTSARLTEDGTGWVAADGSALHLGADASIAPWHPLTVEPSEVQAWRRHIEDTGWRQPFKQAFREIYVLTPAEEETAVYSNRFASHVLDYRRAFALMKERGWGANFLGGWSSGLAGEAKREFPDDGLRAVFYHDPIETEGGGRYDDVRLCSTDQVRFETLGRGERPAVPLVDVPPMVFSEAMRDVDLFVGVSSMANDPTWVDRGADGQIAHWERQAFGALTESAETRRDVLAHLLPKLKIAGVTRLDGRFLEVQGHRHTYRIHLGSGNILMSPNDRFLCIVPSRKPPATALRYVPFEGDERLAVILSKAFLLADDHKITDPTILAQLDGGR